MRYLALLILGLLLAVPTKAQLVHDMSDAHVHMALTATEVVGKRSVQTYQSPFMLQPFTGVAIQGASTDANVKGWIRFGRETEWRPLYLVPSPTDAAFLAAWRSEDVRENITFKLRFDVEEGASLTLREVGIFDNRNDSDRETVPEQTVFPKNAPYQGNVLPPVLITRAEWGAASFRGSPVPLNRPSYNRMTFHHAAGFRADNKADGMRQVKAIQDFHQNGRGWSDIGYQFVVDQAGNVYQGRPFLDNSTTFDEVPQLAQGAHVGGANTGNIGVCLLGCFHPPESAFACNDVITPAALDTMTTIFAFLSEAYGVEPANLLGHRDQGSTSCPGDNNYQLLPQIREDVIRLKIEGNARLGAASLLSVTDEQGIVKVAADVTENNGIATFRLEREYRGETTVIYEGPDALTTPYVDAELTQPGVATYLLYGVAANGRQQLLATTTTEVLLPNDWVLTQAFPNPFQQQSTLRYYLAQDGIVSLVVYDNTGREINTLVDGTFQEGDQWYQHVFDASTLSSGLYYYQIKVEGFSGNVFDETRALVVVQ